MCVGVHSTALVLYQIDQEKNVGNSKCSAVAKHVIFLLTCLQYAAYICITFGCVVMGISVLLSVSKIMSGNFKAAAR